MYKNKSNWLTGFVSEYKGHIIEILRKVGNGKIREVARRAPGVRGIAITDAGKFIISHERREYLESEYDYRLPGGKVVDTLSKYHEILANGTLQEEIDRAMDLELLQETGYKARSKKLIAVSNSGGTIDWDLHYYELKELEFVGQHLEEDEQIEVIEMTVDTVINLVLTKQMSEDRSRMILFDYLMKHYPENVMAQIRALCIS